MDWPSPGKNKRESADGTHTHCLNANAYLNDFIILDKKSLLMRGVCVFSHKNFQQLLFGNQSREMRFSKLY